MNKLLEIALPINLNKTLYYLPKFEYKNENIDNLIGKRVIVELKNKKITGVVINTQELDKSYNYKEINEVLDDNPIFTPKIINLIKWVSDYYISPLGEVYKTAFPLGLSKKTTIKYKLNPNYNYILKNLIQSLDKDDIDLFLKLIDKIGFEKSFALDSKLLTSESQKFYKKTIKILIENDLFIKLENLIQLKEKQIEKIKFSFNLMEINNIEEIKSQLKKSKSQLLLFNNLLEYFKNNNLNDILLYELKKLDFKITTLNELIKKNILVKYSEKTERNKNKLYTNVNRKNELKLELNELQNLVYNSIKNSSLTNSESNLIHLIYGITGSGKTLIYLRLINDIIMQGKNVLLLLPEIALTPQIIERFEVAFPNQIAILHSKLNDNERYDTWLKIANSEFKIVIGVRSSVFAPLSNLGMIIIDEEHDSSYKQESTNLNYNARDVAIMRGHLENCPVILGSATPSLESYYNAMIGKYKLHTILQRNDGATLPDFIVIDKVDNGNFGQNLGLFSKELVNEISDKVQKQEQVILFLNRRGYSPLIECLSCGQSEKCPNCEINLTYHKSSPHLRCHFCGYKKINNSKCSYCNNETFKISGYGTQRIEEELIELLNENINQVNAIRLDADTGNTENKLKKIIIDFENQKYNVLIGTQMVSKGLDFENVTLIGLLNPDTSLFHNDFRAAERTFQLLTQVSGRAGRNSNKKGFVLIQTKNEKHFVFDSVLKNNPLLFYKKELDYRKKLNYPPFYRIIKIEFKSRNNNIAINSSKLFYNLLYSNNLDNDKIIIYEPFSPFVGQIAKIHRVHLILKVNKEWDKSGMKTNKLLIKNLENFNKLYSFNDLRVNIDIDAYNIMS